MRRCYYGDFCSAAARVGEARIMPITIVYDLITAICTMPMEWLHAAVACCLIGMFVNMCSIRGHRGDDIICD